MAIAKTIEGLTALKAEILQKHVDFVVVNTDGWVAGDIAVRYKTALVEGLKPDVIVGIEVADELDELSARLEQPMLKVEASAALNPRTAEKRKSLREMTYAKYLKDAKLETTRSAIWLLNPQALSQRIKRQTKDCLWGFTVQEASS